MKHSIKIKIAFDWFVGIASLIGVAVTLWSTWIAYRTSRKAQEIVQEVHQYYHDTVIEHQRDTVYVKVPELVTIVRRDTVYFPLIYSPDTGNTTILSDEEMDVLRRDRDRFLDLIERMKAQRNK